MYKNEARLYYCSTWIIKQHNKIDTPRRIPGRFLFFFFTFGYSFVHRSGDAARGISDGFAKNQMKNDCSSALLINQYCCTINVLKKKTIRRSVITPITCGRPGVGGGGKETPFDARRCVCARVQRQNCNNTPLVRAVLCDFPTWRIFRARDTKRLANEQQAKDVRRENLVRAKN